MITTLGSNLTIKINHTTNDLELDDNGNLQLDLLATQCILNKLNTLKTYSNYLFGTLGMVNSVLTISTVSAYIDEIRNKILAPLITEKVLTGINTVDPMFDSRTKRFAIRITYTPLNYTTQVLNLG